MQTIKFDLPFKVSTNEIYSGCHWTKRKQHKDIMLWAFLGVKSQLKPVDKCTIKFEFYFKSRPLDNTNCSYLAKLMEDCLVHYKILKDDNYKIVEEITISSRKGDKDQVLITLTENNDD